jgi:hypothetical protein
MDARCNIGPLTIFGKLSPRPRTPSGRRVLRRRASRRWRNTGAGPIR